MSDSNDESVREPKNIIHERYCLHARFAHLVATKIFYPPFKVLVVFGIADPDELVRSLWGIDAGLACARRLVLIIP